MNITLETVRRNTENAEKTEELARKTFPPEELSSLLPLMEDEKGFGEVLSIQQNGAFAGFCACLNVGNICHVIYFAVREDLRGRGIGREALNVLAEIKEDRRIIVDIEQPTEDAENLPERLRRKNFYLRNGFSETETKYNWRGVDYEILSCGGFVSDAEFWDFWKVLEDADGKYLIY